MSLSPLLFRGENFDGQTPIFVDFFDRAGTVNGIHTLQLRGATNVPHVLTDNTGVMRAGVQVSFPQEGVFGGTSFGLVTREGEGIGEYVDGLEWRVTLDQGTWYEFTVPTNTWLPMPSSVPGPTYRLQAFPGSGGARYTFSLRRGTATVFTRQYSWVS